MVLCWLLSLWLHLCSFAGAAVCCLLSVVMLTMVLAVSVVHAAIVLLPYFLSCSSVVFFIVHALVLSVVAFFLHF